MPQSRQTSTKEGGIDWVQLDNTDFGAFNRKDTEDPAIGGPTLIGKQDYVAQNTKTNFVFLDGVSPVQSIEDNNHKGLVFTGEGNGLEFTLPASKEERYVNIYSGAWAADITAEVLVNGDTAYIETFGSTDTTSGTPLCTGCSACPTAAWMKGMKCLLSFMFPKRTTASGEICPSLPLH